MFAVWNGFGVQDPDQDPRAKELDDLKEEVVEASGSEVKVEALFRVSLRYMTKT